MDFLSRYSIPIAVSVLLHVAVFWVMGGEWTEEREKKILKKPNYVEAKLVKLEQKAKKKKPKKAARIDIQKRKKAEEAKRKAKLAAKRKAEKARRDAEAKRKKAEKNKREEERRRKEREKQQELERLRLQELAMTEALAEEEAEMVAEENARVATSYVSIIQQRIEANWSRPPSARKGMEVELSIQLVPTGQVVNVSITKSSGNAAFDRSAEQAVRKADRFPELQGMDSQVFEQYFRKLTLNFNPQDLRL